MTLFSFWQTDQWASSNALQKAPCNGVAGLRDYAHVHVNHLVSLPKNKHFSYVAVYVLETERTADASYSYVA